MRHFDVEVAGYIYPVDATREDLAAKRAIAIARSTGRSRDIIAAARGPVGLSITVWDRGTITKSATPVTTEAST